MPFERKPLFNSRLLEARLAGFSVEQLDTKIAAVGLWRTTLERGRLQKTKETQLQGLFLAEFFRAILGYKALSEGADSWSYAQEETVEVDGKCADAVVGHFTDEHKTYVAAIELKGAGTSLDATGPSGRSAVEQCYQYATNLPCNWVIVSNYRETRLYHKNRTQQHYEVFRLEDLPKADELKRFCYLLCADHVVARKGASVIDRLLEETGEEEERITGRLYAEYKQIRLTIFDALRRDNPGQDDHRLLEKAQKILDRVLFVCFCEDRGLLPHQIIDRAYEQQNPFSPVPIWRNFVGLFHAIDEGNEPLKIPGYNGGLFATDEVLDGLTVSDEVCELFRKLGHYDYAAEVNVDILGHIFEQSISDIESLKAELAGETVDKKQSKRKKEGVYYTPEYITRYIVEETVGGYLKERFAQLEATHAIDRIPTSHTKRRGRAEIELWTDYQEALKRTRVLDPACGSGAFLIQAFDFLAAEYERCNTKLATLRGGQLEITDLNRLILSNNLYGVDINPEAVEITKLSLWLKTAESGKQLTYLDGNILLGNSLVDDRSVDSRALDWQAAFPEIMNAGGFDCVVGNPPYVRQEAISEYKPYFEGRWPNTYHGMADLYVYFIERGVDVLRRDGLLGFIMSNKWLRTGYGEALRTFSSRQAKPELLVDFGHAPIFPEADTFPCIVLLRKVREPVCADTMCQVCSVPRDDPLSDGLREFVQRRRYAVPLSQFQPKGWMLERPDVQALMEKIANTFAPLDEYVGSKPFFGVKTGLNEAFVIEQPLRDRLVNEDPDCAGCVRRMLRGRDIKRWLPEWGGRWLILLRSSNDHEWPWSGAGKDAESVFSQRYPSLYAYMKPYEDRLRRRQDQGRFWWELRSCNYYDVFERPKIVCPDITWRSEFGLDTEGYLAFDTSYAIPTADAFIVSVLNSPIMWWYLWRAAQHCKDEGLRLRSLLGKLPLPEADEETKAGADQMVVELRRLTEVENGGHQRMLSWLALEFGVEKPSQKLQNFSALGEHDFLCEIKKVKKRLSSAEVGLLTREFQEIAPTIRKLRGEQLQLECQLSDIVNAAYGLTPEEIDLVRGTMPPRDPISTIRQKMGVSIEES